MVVLEFVFVLLFFLVSGVAVFGIFLAVPRFRAYALSAALWCACWGPCIVALQALAGLTLITEELAVHQWGRENIPMPGMPVWSSYAFLGLVSTLIFATSTSWLHQMIIGRMTFALFRVYATGVLAGMGSVLGWVWVLWLTAAANFPSKFIAALIGIAMLTLIFGVWGWQFARTLRGRRPEDMQWITAEEFDGLNQG